MTYQVLARKWRPKDFASLVGQEHVVRALTHALDGGRLHHAYLFTGTRGVGKTTLSRIFAKALNCETGVSSTPCGVCRACREIDEGRFVDYVEMDAASNRGVDEMAALLERAVYAPVDARFKVYMIDEVHMLTNHAFNAMLKTLEEPPPHVKFILATTDPQKIPVTVLSRCLQFNLKQMPAGHIVGHLERILGEEGVPFDAQALRLLARAAEGSMRDALSLTDQAIAYSANQISEDAVRGMLGALDQSYLIRLLDALVDGDGAAVLSVADEMALRSLSFPTALQDLASLLHRVGWAQFAPASVLDEWPEAQDIRRFAQALSPEQVQLFYQIATIGRAELGLAPDEYAGFTMALLRMLAFEPASGGAAGGSNGVGGAAAGGLPTGAAGRRGSAAAVTTAQMQPAVSAGSRPSSPAGLAAVTPAARRDVPAGPEQASPRAVHGSAAAGQASPAAVRPDPGNPADDVASAAPVPQTDRDAAAAAGVSPAAAEQAGEPADVVDDPGTREVAIASSGPAEDDASAAQASQRVASDAVSGAAAPSMPASDALSQITQMSPITADSTIAASSAATPEVLAETATPSLTATTAPSRLPSAVDALAAVPGSITEASADAAPRRGGASAALDVLRNAGMKLSSERGRAAPAAPKPAAPRASAPTPVPAARRAQDAEPAREVRETGEVRNGSDRPDAAGPAAASAVPPWEEIPPDDYVPLSSEDDYFGALPDDGYVPAFDRGPDDVRVAAPAPVPVDTRPLPPAIPLDAIGFAGEWPALAADLPLKGIAYQLAFNSELTALDGHTLQLSVPVPQYAEASQVAKLKAALAERVGRALDVQVDVGPARRTAAAFDATARAQRQQDAEREIGADPFVQSLIREFGARIVPGSVKPIAPDAAGNPPSTH